MINERWVSKQENSRTLDQELGHRNKAKDIGGKHAVYVCIGDLSDVLNSQDESSIVYCREGVKLCA